MSNFKPILPDVLVRPSFPGVLPLFTELRASQQFCSMSFPSQLNLSMSENFGVFIDPMYCKHSVSVFSDFLVYRFVWKDLISSSINF